MILPPCLHRSDGPGQHKCSLKRVILTEDEAQVKCWACEEISYDH